VICSRCGGKEISEFRRFASVERESQELSMENFEKITSRYEPIRERVHVPHSGKGSRKSKMAVRLQYLKRRILNHFRRPNNREW